MNAAPAPAPPASPPRAPASPVPASPVPASPVPTPPASSSSSSSSSSDSESEHENSPDNSIYSAELPTQGIEDHPEEQERLTEAEKNERMQKNLMVSPGSEETAALLI